MKVVVDAHNADYYEQRAIEAIHLGRSVKNTLDYEAHINQALGLLALAKVTRRGLKESKAKARSGKNNPGRNNTEADPS